MRRIYFVMLILLWVVPAFGDNLIDSSAVNIKPVEELNMSGILPSYAVNAVKSSPAEVPDYNLVRMKQMNPDFTTYPEASGIIWLKHAVYSRAPDGGMETVRLYVILGRRGLGEKWLNWNIQTPARGTIEILEASVYDYNSLAKISTISPEEDNDAGITALKFQGLPETFIIVMAWREEMLEQLSVEGLSWFQEDLRVWEAVVEVYSPQKLAWKTFPEPRSPEVQDLKNETSYTWRRINLDPYISAGELARIKRSGAAFSPRQGSEGLATVLKEAESPGNIPIHSEALSAFKRSGASGLIEWLRDQPEIELAEGGARRIPSSGALTKREKLLLARSWLNAQKVEASLCWQLPFDPEDRTPLCSGMFYSPVLEVKDSFHDMIDSRLLDGAKVFAVSSEGRMFSKRIPSSKPTDNRLSAIMDLRLNEQGFLSGTVKVTLRGAWEALMLGSSPSDGTVRGALLSLFPGLTNYRDVKYRKVKDVPEISFVVDNKPGIAGTGRGFLSILPFFEPPAMRKLGMYEAPVEILFPFVIEQNITLGFPKSASQALVQGNIGRGPEKINFTSNYQNRRHRLLANARLEVNMPSVSSGNMSLLQRNLENWRIFSARHIPVR